MIDGGLTDPLFDLVGADLAVAQEVALALGEHVGAVVVAVLVGLVFVVGPFLVVVLVGIGCSAAPVLRSLIIQLFYKSKKKNFH